MSNILGTELAPKTLRAELSRAKLNSVATLVPIV